MKIVYPPSEKTLKLIDDIKAYREAHPEHKSPYKLAEIFNKSQTYISGLLRWDREERKK
jgi:hypothetical protein